MRHTIIILLSLLLTGCSWTYARLTYDFESQPGHPQILYEPGAEDMAQLVATHLGASIGKVEQTISAMMPGN